MPTSRSLQLDPGPRLLQTSRAVALVLHPSGVAGVAREEEVGEEVAAVGQGKLPFKKTQMARTGQ